MSGKILKTMQINEVFLLCNGVHRVLKLTRKAISQTSQKNVFSGI